MKITVTCLKKQHGITWVPKPWAYFVVGQRNDNGSHGSPTTFFLYKMKIFLTAFFFRKENFFDGVFLEKKIFLTAFFFRKENIFYGSRYVHGDRYLGR